MTSYVEALVSQVSSRGVDVGILPWWLLSAPEVSVLSWNC